MLDRVDRVLLVVDDRPAAVATWQQYFGAELVGETESTTLNARITTVRAGETEFEFVEPIRPGPAAEFAHRWRQGLFAAGFSTPDLDALESNLVENGITPIEDGDRLFIDGAQTHGMPAIISASEPRQRVGHINFVYEVTNVVPDWQKARDDYARVFGLDASRFSYIKSDRFGYEGTLTLFNPPERLDRIEITQTSGESAMQRFYEKRGASLYMCYIETDDVMGLAERLKATNAQFVHSEKRAPEAGLFIHPSSLHGMLMGVSLTNYAWVWSGRPELAGPLAAGREEH